MVNTLEISNAVNNFKIKYPEHGSWAMSEQIDKVLAVVTTIFDRIIDFFTFGWYLDDTRETIRDCLRSNDAVLAVNFFEQEAKRLAALNAAAWASA